MARERFRAAGDADAVDAFIADYLDREGDAVFGCVGTYRIEGLGAQLFTRVSGDPFVIQGLPLLARARLSADARGGCGMISAGVIGWPVAHSKSPLIHRFWLAKLGLDGDYGRFPVHPDGLGEAIRALPALGLRGVNVTVPHKVAVMAYLDRVDALAAKVGAVNTVVVEDGALAGYNSDVAGVARGTVPALT